MNTDNNRDKPCGKVEAVFSTCQRIVQVHLGGSVVRTTADHPFYVEGKGWVNAAEMPGATSDGEQAVFRPAASEQFNTEQPVLYKNVDHRQTAVGMALGEVNRASGCLKSGWCRLSNTLEA